MATVQQQKDNVARIWQALNDLEFVTSFFTWLFRLMSRLAEPMMTLSAIYIIIEAGVPLVSVPALHWLSVALLISAPEIILPGGFILAGELHEAKNQRWWMLLLMCWAFVLLTTFTLLDLFVLHLQGTGFQVLMWFRCAAAFGYSILFRVITHRHEVAEMSPQSEHKSNEDSVVERIHIVTSGLQQSVQSGVASIRQELQQMEAIQLTASTRLSTQNVRVRGVPIVLQNVTPFWTLPLPGEMASDETQEPCEEEQEVSHDEQEDVTESVTEDETDAEPMTDKIRVMKPRRSGTQKRPSNNQLERRIRRLASEQVKPGDIAKRLNISRTTVYRYLGNEQQKQSS